MNSTADETVLPQVWAEQILKTNPEAADTLRRILAKVKIKNGVYWIWTGTRNNGFPTILINGRPVSLRPLIFTLNGGSIPAGSVVKATCNIPLCLNPAHFYPMTRGEVAAILRDNRWHPTMRALTPEEQELLAIGAKGSFAAAEDVQDWWDWFNGNWEPDENDCLPWKGTISSDGYALVHGQNHYRADYVRWENETGQIIPPGYCLKHTCGNRICGKISHLKLVTRSEVLQRFASPAEQLQAKVILDPATGCHLVPKSDRMVISGGHGRRIYVLKLAYQEEYGPDSVSKGDVFSNSCKPPCGKMCVIPAHIIKESPSEAAKSRGTGRWIRKKINDGEANPANL